MYKTKMKARICLITVILLTLVSSLMGCGGTKQADQTSSVAATTQSPQETTKEEPQLSPAELKWYIGGDANAVKDLPVVLDEVNKTLTEKINATLRIQFIDWGSMEKKMDVIIASNESYDLCFTSSWMNIYTKNVSRGAFAELDGSLDKYGKAIKAAIPEKYWNSVKISGKTYAMLNYQMFAFKQGVTARKDLMDKYQINPADIKKPEDMEAFMNKVKDGEKGVSPVKFSTASLPLEDPDTGALYWNAVSGYGMFVVNGSDKDLKVVNLYETKAYKQRADLVRKWYKGGFIPRDMAVAEKNFSQDAKAGKYAMFDGGNMQPGNETNMKANYGFDVYCMPLSRTYVEQDGITATMTGISKNSKNIDRAVMLYDLLFSDKKLYNTLVYGVEGKHYNKVSEDTIELIPDSGYNSGASWEMGNTFNLYLLKGQQPGIAEESVKMNDEAEPSPLIGFTYDTEPMKTELTAINAVYTEYTPMWKYCMDDPEKYLPVMNEKLKKAGLDKVIADVQAKINEWKTANGK